VSTLTDRIDDAFTRPDLEDAIRLVKDAVHEDLAGLDIGLAIEQTQFFNHTIYPDLVMRWTENGVRNTRSLFLRFEVAEGSVNQDLRLHASDDPIFIGLLDHRPEVERPGDSSLADEPSFSIPDEPEPEPPIAGTLLAEASAIEVLESFAREQAGTNVATGAIARGGHGRLSEAGARALGDGLGIAFAAVREGRDPDLVLSAFGQLEGIISERQAGLVATQLQLLWIESGGDLSGLFGDERMQLERLSDTQFRELLEYLLNRDEMPTSRTLRRIGRVVSADRLGQILGNFAGGHLSAFVEANLDQWTARWVQVRWQKGAGWSLEDELLRLGLGEYQLSFLTRGRKLARSASGNPVARADFTNRLGDDQTIALDLVSRAGPATSLQSGRRCSPPRGANRRARRTCGLCPPSRTRKRIPRPPGIWVGGRGRN
jgi:hypothetical protein